ncbi:MAG: 3-phosphoshikimate 1-carboxyvinyltransferase [Tyzzerella sp.]|nr:3-phosphoshikimate 1-carboxyvinyltransferase [Tyzzerella sp.]
MRVKILPSKAEGSVLAPPSKSMAHRMLMGAGLAEGVSVIGNIDLSEDIKATLGILKALGCDYKIDDRTVTMKGVGKRSLQTEEKLDSKESGSTLRFFIPLLLTGGGKVRFVGAKRLMERPLEIYENICKEQGIFYQRTEQALELEGKLKSTHYKVPGNISSQFITGLLYALPLLEGDSVIEVLPPVESKAYIEMTLEALEYYGIKIQRKENTFYISGGQTYIAKDSVVEGDYSNAAFLDAFNLIGGEVQVEGLREDSLQGDQIYKTYFELLKEDKPVMDIAECPDLGPILMGMAAALHGAKFTGTKRLKIKESDRGTVMAEELKKFGIRVEVLENEITVFPGKLKKPEEVLNSHNDHRIAMTLATLCTITGGYIEGAESVRKSFPNYYEEIQKLGIQVMRED